MGGQRRLKTRSQYSLLLHRSDDHQVPTMLVDNPVQHSFAPYNPSFEDFFNMDLFAGPSIPTAGSSGSSPRSSPSNSYTGLPATPPEPFPLIHDIALSPSPFFTLSQDDEPSKLSSMVPSATTAAGYDFLSTYASQFTQMSSPESSGSGSASFSAASADSPSIDPQLMNTPAASFGQSGKRGLEVGIRRLGIWRLGIQRLGIWRLGIEEVQELRTWEGFWSGV